MKMKYLRCLGCAIALSSFIVSCDKGVNKALDNAGSNRGELKKVLDYFDGEHDGLKGKSAKFLISNMPYN